MGVLHAAGIGNCGDGDRIADLAGLDGAVSVGDACFHLFPRVAFVGVVEEHVAGGVLILCGGEFDGLSNEDELLDGYSLRFAFWILVSCPCPCCGDELLGKRLREVEFLGEFFHAQRRRIREAMYLREYGDAVK